jgi:4-hydroxy-tetrahydrodipicolinate synthase
MNEHITTPTLDRRAQSAAAKQDAGRLRGVLSPVVTPFRADYSADADRLIRHCHWLVRNNVGLAIFGTNSEGNSLSVEERMMLLDRLIDAGIDPARLLPGTGCCALSDSVRLSAYAVTRGCAGVLMLPPFYYKGVADEGLYRNFAEVIEQVGDARTRIYLYHIPPVSQVPITIALIERLLKAYPRNIVGIKDSSGDWNNTEAMLRAFAGTDFAIFAGSEPFLLATMRSGGAGCISATANVNPGPIYRLFASWQDADADAQQAALDVVRRTFQKYPMIPALKQAIAHWSADPGWTKLRPPLVELSDGQASSLIADLKQCGFDMPGLGAA